MNENDAHTQEMEDFIRKLVAAQDKVAVTLRVNMEERDRVVKNYLVSTKLNA